MSDLLEAGDIHLGSPYVRNSQNRSLDSGFRPSPERWSGPHPDSRMHSSSSASARAVKTHMLPSRSESAVSTVIERSTGPADRDADVSGIVSVAVAGPDPLAPVLAQPPGRAQTLTNRSRVSSQRTPRCWRASPPSLHRGRPAAPAAQCACRFIAPADVVRRRTGDCHEGRVEQPTTRRLGYRQGVAPILQQLTDRLRQGNPTQARQSSNSKFAIPNSTFTSAQA